MEEQFYSLDFELTATLLANSIVRGLLKHKRSGIAFNLTGLWMTNNSITEISFFTDYMESGKEVLLAFSGTMNEVNKKKMLILEWLHIVTDLKGLEICSRGTMMLTNSEHDAFSLINQDADLFFWPPVYKTELHYN